MDHGRRKAIAALGVTAPLALARGAWCSTPRATGLAELRFQSFEEAVREAFATTAAHDGGASTIVRRVAVGHCDLLSQGIQGCSNDRPFAGFSAGRLRIVRVGSAPGESVGGVRLYLSTVDVALMTGTWLTSSANPLDFSALPPAPCLVRQDSSQAPRRGDVAGA